MMTPAIVKAGKNRLNVTKTDTLNNLSVRSRNNSNENPLSE